MKKNSKRTGSVKTGQKANSRKRGQITIGLDLGDKTSHYCVLAEDGEQLCQDKVATSKEAMRERFSAFGRVPDRTGGGNAFALGEPVVELARA
jgi:transposase